MFLWLLAALAVDGIDGPLARRAHVRTHAPDIDGVLLDLVVDYLTYVLIPVFALVAAGLLAGWAGLATAIWVCVASALYFARAGMKTDDGSFSGFPACWNMIALAAFVLTPPPGLVLAGIVLLSAAMFMPLKFVHPLRTARWRPLTLSAGLIWAGFGAWAALAGFILPDWAMALFAASSVWLLLAGMVQQVVPTPAQ